MKNRANILAIAATALLTACQALPEVTPTAGKGAIVGAVSTRPHSDLIKKIRDQSAAASDSYGGSADGRIVYLKKMLNYRQIDDIYVGLVGPESPAPAVHDLRATAAGLIPRGIAMATGDTIRIANATSESLTFFVADNATDDIEESEPVPPGQTGELTVTMEGTLDLGVDERDDLEGTVLSRTGMATKRLKSGSDYAFNNLEPGSYQLTFWYWRLGELQRPVTVEPDKVMVINEELAVDRLVKRPERPR